METGERGGKLVPKNVPSNIHYIHSVYNMSNKIGLSVISSDRRRSSNSRLSKVVIEAKRLKSHKKACEDFDN